MTVQEAVLDFLSYAAVYGFVLDGVPEDEAEIVRAVAAGNQALQDIYRSGPLSLKFDSRSSYLNPPTQVSLVFTKGAKTATTATAIDVPLWMRGCSAQIEGDSVLNRVVDIVTEDTVTTVTFLRSYLGASGSHQLTVYGDCVLLDADVAAVLEPVILTPNIRLWPAQTKAGFMERTYWSGTSGRTCWYIPFFTTWEKVTGRPMYYRVEQRSDTARTGGASLYLALNPMPTQEGNVTYDVYRRPIPFSRQDLDEKGGDDPEVPIKALPGDMVESLLLPIGRWRYVSQHPEIRNPSLRQTLKTAFDDAMMALKNGNSLAPQINATHARYI